MRSLSDLYGDSSSEDGKPKATGPQPAPGAEVGELPPGAPPEVAKMLSGDPVNRQAALNGPPTAKPPAMTAEENAEFRRRLLAAIGSARLLAPMPNADSIPFYPEGEARRVTERIEQGPRVFLTKQEAQAKKDQPPPVTQAPPPVTLLPQPDMSKPGRMQANEYVAYRPGANKPLGVYRKPDNVPQVPADHVSRENQGGTGG